MDIQELVDCSFIGATDRGFWEKNQNFGEKLMLIVSELSEALEAHRSGKRCNVKEYLKCCKLDGFNMGYIFNKTAFEKYIRGTVEEELADVMIRVADLCGHLKIDLDQIIKLKLAYNRTRPKLHGKEY
jgi:NTP pyrophosphatase (non-canonical NTP hydrolase)